MRLTNTVTVRQHKGKAISVFVRFVADHGSEMGEVRLADRKDVPRDQCPVKLRTGLSALQFKGSHNGMFELELWRENSAKANVPKDWRSLRLETQGPLKLTFDAKKEEIREAIVAFFYKRMRYAIPRALHESEHGPGLARVWPGGATSQNWSIQADSSYIKYVRLRRHSKLHA